MATSHKSALLIIAFLVVPLLSAGGAYLVGESAGADAGAQEVARLEERIAQMERRAVGDRSEAGAARRGRCGGDCPDRRVRGDRPRGLDTQPRGAAGGATRA